MIFITNLSQIDGTLAGAEIAVTSAITAHALKAALKQHCLTCRLLGITPKNLIVYQII